MKRNDAEQIGDMIRKFFRLNGLESPLNEYRLVQAWKDVVGPAIAGYTSNLYIKNQILYVHLTSSVLRQELMMGRDLLVRNLNKQVGYCKYYFPVIIGEGKSFLFPSIPRASVCQMILSVSRHLPENQNKYPHYKNGVGEVTGHNILSLYLIYCHFYQKKHRG